MTQAMITGFLTGLGLILAIGAQNAFVLRQGLRRSHVGAVVAVCALSDALLIGIGVAGFDAATRVIPALAPLLLWAGVAFLATYGTLRLRAAWRGGEALQPAADRPEPLGKVLATCLLLTWANPHVWLDTVVLLGSVSSRHAPWQAAFGLGAATASVVFFSTLGYGARALAPVFARPRAWVWLEAGVGLLMWALALGLAFS
ncbi:LysE/ArgO family amino acid transporter [Neotabrizicola sp. VNH66]|uniref:LysE/ArgO family amino acid transporter n=1 Tax=Neotabrizicola sp. VNH66 TaxID=3400918 RepID=UPI003C012ED8